MPGVYREHTDVASVHRPDSPMARYACVNPYTCDDASAECLWELSDAMIGFAPAREKPPKLAGIWA